MSDRGYIVVPFIRVGDRLGPRQMLFFDALNAARFTARQIAGHVPGVAIIERHVDTETGESIDQLIEDIGAVPPNCPSRWDWTARLN